MTSTIKVNTITTESGSTLTIGESGKTVSLASGASQTGFGREGSVNWQTTIKTGDFTAANGEGYFINTTSGPITMTLPSSPSAGDIVALKDYANTFDTQNLTIGRNGSNISGEAKDAVISVEGQALTIVYGDATKGWQAVAAATEADLPKPQFIVASGGNSTTTIGDFKVHAFTGPGTFTVCSVGNAAGSNTVETMIVAGGGGAGFDRSGGAGAGGMVLTPTCGVPVTATGFAISVGGGGAGIPNSLGPGPHVGSS